MNTLSGLFSPRGISPLKPTDISLHPTRLRNRVTTPYLTNSLKCPQPLVFYVGMVEANLIHALGESGASEKYVSAVMAGSPNGVRNHARAYAILCQEVTGREVYAPTDNFPGLRALWDGDVERAYRKGDADLGILLEEAFTPEDLGMPSVSEIEPRYEMLAH